ncbi:MAG: DUF1292 domain-containing protein [Symbiobacteriaceae bacterium]|nr:DUF1292 domain-containing protein [Symbiobacteriaceae bacterium]
MNEEKDLTLDEEEEIDVVTVVDEEGREHEFELFTVLEVDGKEYAVLYPLDDEDDDEETEAIILRIENDEDGEETLVDIEDETEWNRVVAAWEDIISDEDEEEN